MRKIKINGKEYRIKASFDSVRRLLAKYGEKIEKSYKDPDRSVEVWEGDQMIMFGVELLWEFLQPNIFGLKPYITRKRFEKKVDIADVRDNYVFLMSILFGTGDREPKKE